QAALGRFGVCRGGHRGPDGVRNLGRNLGRYARVSPQEERARPAGRLEKAGGGEAPPPDPPKSSKKAKPRRAGRLRSFVLRPLVWGSALFLLLFAGSLAYIESSYARSRLATLVIARLSEALGRPFRVGSAQVGLLPL